MNKETFDQLGKQPGLRVMWGGKPYRLRSVNHKTGTCFIVPLMLNRTPYAVGYERVEIAEVQHPRSCRSRREPIDN